MTLANTAVETADTSPSEPPFYLVAIRQTDTTTQVERLDEEFETHEVALARAKALVEDLGCKVEVRQDIEEDAWDEDPPEEKGSINYDPENPVHVRVMRLYDILSWRRPKDGWGEAQMIAGHIDTVPGMMKDLCGNRYICVGDQDKPRILWSCHTDTVHHEDGVQTIEVTGNRFIQLAPSSKSSCLGADDGAGVFLMLEMIDAGVEGLYVFHYGEERGGIGSRWLTKNTPHLVDGIQYAIAFDRRGLTDVITHQSGGRCCSDDFARSLAAQLPSGYKPSPDGVYTDTAEYTGLIPECTNISVGYFSEHSANERIDVVHLLNLRESLIELDIDQLVVSRKAGDIEYDYGNWGSYFDDRYQGYGANSSRGRISRSAYGTYGMLGEADDEDWARDAAQFEGQGDDTTWRSRRSGRGFAFKPRSLVDLLEQYPVQAAEILEQYGVELETLWTDISQQYDIGDH